MEHLSNFKINNNLLEFPTYKFFNDDKLETIIHFKSESEYAEKLSELEEDIVTFKSSCFESTEEAQKWEEVSIERDFNRSFNLPTIKIVDKDNSTRTELSIDTLDTGSIEVLDALRVKISSKIERTLTKDDRIILKELTCENIKGAIKERAIRLFFHGERIELVSIEDVDYFHRVGIISRRKRIKGKYLWITLAIFIVLVALTLFNLGLKQ